MPSPENAPVVDMIGREVFGQDFTIETVQRVNVVGALRSPVERLGGDLIEQNRPAGVEKQKSFRAAFKTRAWFRRVSRRQSYRPRHEKGRHQPADK